MLTMSRLRRAVARAVTRARATARLAAILAAASILLVPLSSGSQAAGADWPETPHGFAYQTPSRCNGSSAPASIRPNEASYPVCADQLVVFNEALTEASKTSKLLIVDFGATWCPWCKSLQGQFKSGLIADPEKFHVVEIALSTTNADGRREDIVTGHAVLGMILSHRPEVTQRSVPFLAVIDPAHPDRTVARNLDDLEAAGAVGHQADRVRAFILAAETSIKQGTPAPMEPGWISKKLTRLWDRVAGH
jgi:thiol-disulfide isomerase/thioredoxin